LLGRHSKRRRLDLFLESILRHPKGRESVLGTDSEVFKLFLERLFPIGTNVRKLWPGLSHAALTRGVWRSIHKFLAEERCKPPIPRVPAAMFDAIRRMPRDLQRFFPWDEPTAVRVGRQIANGIHPTWAVQLLIKRPDVYENFPPGAKYSRFFKRGLVPLVEATRIDQPTCRENIRRQANAIARTLRTEWARVHYSSAHTTIDRPKRSTRVQESAAATKGVMLSKAQ
jgi:hypothetical protein